MTASAELIGKIATLAHQSAAKGDYASGAVLLDNAGKILYEATGDVATNEPHGVQAEVNLLHAYFADQKTGAVLPPLKDCSIVTLSEPAASAGQIVQAGVGKVSYILANDFAGLAKSSSWPRSQEQQVERTFSQLEVGDETVQQLQALADTSSQAVRASKKALMDVIKTQWPQDFDNLPAATADKSKALIKSQSKNAFTMKATFGEGYTLDPASGNNRQLLELLAEHAKQSAAAGYDTNAVLILDKAGNFLALMGDESKDNPLQTPLMRAVDTAHEWGRLANMQGTDIDPAQQTPVPHANALVFVALKEPNMMELARLSQPGNQSTVYLQKDVLRGMQSSGADQKLPEFYTKVKSSGQMLKYAGDPASRFVGQQLRDITRAG